MGNFIGILRDPLNPNAVVWLRRNGGAHIFLKRQGKTYLLLTFRSQQEVCFAALPIRAREFTSEIVVNQLVLGDQQLLVKRGVSQQLLFNLRRLFRRQLAEKILPNGFQFFDV